MDHFVPRANGRLVDVAIALAKHPQAIVERASHALLEGDPAYAALPASIRSDVRDAVEFATRLWLKAVVDGRAPGEEELLSVAESNTNGHAGAMRCVTNCSPSSSASPRTPPRSGEPPTRWAWMPKHHASPWRSTSTCRRCCLREWKASSTASCCPFPDA